MPNIVFDSLEKPNYDQLVREKPQPTPTISTENVGETPEPQFEPVGENPPVYSGSIYPEEMIDAICNQGFDWDCDTALYISWREMGRYYHPRDAWNDIPVWLVGENHATGLFQLILPFHYGLFDGDPYDPYVNARAAYKLYSTNGWTPWGF